MLAAPRLTTMEVLRATGKASDGPVSSALNRPLSRRLSALLLRFPSVRPVHATCGTAAIASAMFAALLSGGVPGLVAGGLLFQAASVFDGVDGEIARATFRTSQRGATLDTLVDVATNLLFFFGVTLALARGGRAGALWLGGWGLAMFAIGLLVQSRRAVRAPGGVGLDGVKQALQGRFVGVGAALVTFGTVVTSRDFFALLFAVLLVAGRPLAVLWIFAVAATIWLVFVLVAVPPRGASPQRNA
jgi:CDP-L-myo-inositol myo-inositolphosphotransferase